MRQIITNDHVERINLNIILNVLNNSTLVAKLTGEIH